MISFLFHGLFKDRNEAKEDQVDPQQGITAAQFAEFVQYFERREYSFVSPRDVISGLSDESRNVLITFDDGYFNQTRALRTLEEYGTPAVFFVSCHHVITGNTFWWDALYRSLKLRGASNREVARERVRLSSGDTPSAEGHLRLKFGSRVLEPLCDVDRPLSVDELRLLSRERLITIGNHTFDHRDLTKCSKQEAYREIREAQDCLGQMVGYEPKIIAYPYGRYSNQVVAASAEAGLKLGVTADRRKDFLPLSPDPMERMQLGRFVLWGSRGIARQCKILESDFLVSSVAGRILRNPSY